jgi:hypothetical protein
MTEYRSRAHAKRSRDDGHPKSSTRQWSDSTEESTSTEHVSRQIQQHAGNQRIQRLASKRTTDLQLAEDERTEREADAVASSVTSLLRTTTDPVASARRDPTPDISASPERDPDGVQRMHDDGATGVPPVVDDVVSSQGEPLPGTVQRTMEAYTGHDFGSVDVHTGPRAARSADAVNARAYTVGDDIVFNRGEYAPDTDGGQHVLAHELTHVAQQTGGVARLQRMIQSEENGIELVDRGRSSRSQEGTPTSSTGAGNDRQRLMEELRLIVGRYRNRVFPVDRTLIEAALRDGAFRTLHDRNYMIERGRRIAELEDDLTLFVGFLLQETEPGSQLRADVATAVRRHWGALTEAERDINEAFVRSADTVTGIDTRNRARLFAEIGSVVRQYGRNTRSDVLYELERARLQGQEYDDLTPFIRECARLRLQPEEQPPHARPKGERELGTDRWTQFETALRELFSEQWRSLSSNERRALERIPDDASTTVLDRGPPDETAGDEVTIPMSASPATRSIEQLRAYVDHLRDEIDFVRSQTIDREPIVTYERLSEEVEWLGDWLDSTRQTDEETATWVTEWLSNVYQEFYRTTMAAALSMDSQENAQHELLGSVERLTDHDLLQTMPLQRGAEWTKILADGPGWSSGAAWRSWATNQVVFAFDTGAASDSVVASGYSTLGIVDLATNLGGGPSLRPSDLAMLMGFGLTGYSMLTTAHELPRTIAALRSSSGKKNELQGATMKSGWGERFRQFLVEQKRQKQRIKAIQTGIGLGGTALGFASLVPFTWGAISGGGSGTSTGNSTSPANSTSTNTTAIGLAPVQYPLGEEMPQYDISSVVANNAASNNTNATGNSTSPLPEPFGGNETASNAYYLGISGIGFGLAAYNNLIGGARLLRLALPEATRAFAYEDTGEGAADALAEDVVYAQRGTMPRLRTDEDNRFQRFFSGATSRLAGQGKKYRPPRMSDGDPTNAAWGQFLLTHFLDGRPEDYDTERDMAKNVSTNMQWLFSNAEQSYPLRLFKYKLYGPSPRQIYALRLVSTYLYGTPAQQHDAELLMAGLGRHRARGWEALKSGAVPFTIGDPDDPLETVRENLETNLKPIVDSLAAAMKR